MVDDARREIICARTSAGVDDINETHIVQL